MSMNNLDRFIAYFAPYAALRRKLARESLQVDAERFYEAGRPSRLRKTRSDRGSGDAVVGNAGDSLRIQARHLDENHDLARSVLSTLVNNVVGTGIRTEPQVKDSNRELLREFNRELLELFSNWVKKPEVTWEHHWSGVQRLAARTWFRDGEVLVQRLGGNVSLLDHGTRVPYSIELIEPDYLPMDLDDTGRGIVQGVEKNAWGRPRAYYFYKQHPGDPHTYVQFRTDTKRVAAENVLHLKMADRIKQTRGVSIFAAVLTRLDDLKEYEEAERTAAKVAASMCAFIRKSLDGEMGKLKADQVGNRTMRFKPGMVFDNLLPGEEIATVDSKRPNQGLESFRQGQLRAVAGGTSTGYSSIAKDYNGTYSAQRQELVEQSINYMTLREYFVERFMRPIWEDFVTYALVAGVIRPPAGVNEATLLDAEFRGPSLPWIDPVKEITAEEKAVQAGFKSRSQVIRERGGNPDDVFEQIRREREEEAEAGITFTSNAGTAQTDDVAPEPEEEEPEEETPDADADEADEA